MPLITIDVEQLYHKAEGRQARLAELPEYEARCLELAGLGNRVTLTGAGPIWLYLRLAHALHGKAKALYYASPVTGEVEIFNHDPS